MKRSITILILLATIGVMNSYGAAAGPGEMVKVKAKGICYYSFGIAGTLKIKRIRATIRATHDLDSGQVWFVDMPNSSSIKRSKRIPTVPQKVLSFYSRIDPVYYYDTTISNGIDCKWWFWFTGLNGKSFFGQNESMLRRVPSYESLSMNDLEELNQTIKAFGSTDTLTAGDTANYFMAEFSDSIEILMPDEAEPDSAVCYLDNDGDGFGDTTVVMSVDSTLSCPSGYVEAYTNIHDCDDNDPLVNPSQFEECNGRDSDCNGLVDDGCMPPMREGAFSLQDPVIVGESPNPFEDRVTINYSILENNALIEMQVFDITGKLVTNLVKETQPSGDYRVEWTPESKVTFGVYHLKVNIISSAGEVQTINRKLIYNR